MKKILLTFMFLPVVAWGQTRYDFEKMQTERLDRGVVAVRMSADSVMVSWRYLRTDREDTWFEVYRDGKKVGSVQRDHGTYFIDYNPSGKRAKYVVKANAPVGPILEGEGEWTLPADAPVGYIDIPLEKPTGYKDRDGRPVEYVANDATAADLDGDGQMEIILKWDPSNSKDNSHSGITNNTFIDAYKIGRSEKGEVKGEKRKVRSEKRKVRSEKRNGKGEKRNGQLSNCKLSNCQILWRIDLGPNIRSGAHYTPFIVADLDGDGCAELLVRTSDGTIDGTGTVLGDAKADHVRHPDTTPYQANNNPGEQFRGPGWPNNMDRKAARGGFICKGPEWVTCFDGRTGRAISSADYLPARGELKDWGDNYANRSDRFLAACGYLDGKHLSAIFCRGYYTRTGITAYDFDGKQLKVRWTFDTNTPEWRRYAGQGNHNVRVADVDGDGCDEITYGSMALDHDGKGLYNTGMGHGDAMHLTAFFPNEDALQLWDCHENKRDGSDFRDARTGKVLFQIRSDRDVGRCMAADIDPANPGLEMWSSASGGVCNVRGEVIDSTASIPINFGIWWDGDLLRELLDHETVSKYRPTTGNAATSEESLTGTPYDFTGSRSTTTLARFEDCAFNNGTKSNPALCGDILGDWREEVLTRTKDSEHLRLYVTPMPTPYRFHTFLHDPAYRHSITMQNVGYNQPTQVGFYFGAELKDSGRTFRGWKF